jgi:ABC-type transport system involved in multi-copper enzyme maturation permease subunit
MNLKLTIARQMAAAEFLKLRKRRSLLAWALVLAAGSVTVAFAFKGIQHASDPTRPPAGGLNGFRHTLEIIGIFIGPLAAVLIGAEAGAGDSASGVFRDLVVTGRSRLALFAARIPGALMLCLPVIAVAYGLLVAGTFLLAGGSPTPSAGTVLDGFGWAMLVDGAVCVVAVGLASLTNSRPATITTLIGFELVASPLLLEDSSLGSARKALLDTSVLHLSPTLSQGAPVIAESLFLALLVLAVWLLVAAGIGAWRTSTMDA